MIQRNNSKKNISALLAVFLAANLLVGGSSLHTVEASPQLNTKPTISSTPASPTTINHLPIQQSPLVFPKPDFMAPVIDLSTLSASTSLAQPGDLVKIRVKVTDDNTGVQLVGFTLDNENGGHRNFKLTRPEDDGYYTVDFLVDENTHHGQWTLKFLEASDNNSNHRFYNSLTDDLSRASFKVNNPKADMTAPVAQLSTLSVNKKTLVPGDSVKVGIMASDEKTRVELVQFSYINENNSEKTLVATGKDKDGFYYGISKIDENTHSGKWNLINIRVVDSNDNIRNYSSYDLDLSKGNFEVTNPSVDMEGPIIDLNSLSISRRTAYPGEQVIYKVKASDLKSGIDYVEFELVNERGGKYTAIDKTKDSQGYYSFTFNVYDTTQPGKWLLAGVAAYDRNNNFTGYWAGDFDVDRHSLQVMESNVSKNPLDVIYVNRDTTWNYQVIEGDVYIGPDAHVVMGDVTIKGNLFVLGSVESLYRLRANKAYVKSFNQDGKTSRANGALSIVEGSYEFDLIQSEQPIPSIPLLVTSENQVTSKGILPALDGGTLPFGKLYVDGAPVTYNYNGTFNLKNLDVAKQTQVELVLVDVFGKTHRTRYELDNPYFTPSINTIAGSNRFHTAAKISQASHQTSDTAILVQSNNFPDALAAGPLAYQMEAPILLTKANALHSVTEAELKRLKAKHVVIMGGAGAVSPEVETAIKKLGITVERISGSNRYATAVEAGKKLHQVQAKRNAAVLASGQSFPDALAAGSFAAREGMPILLTNSLRLTESTAEFLSKANIKELYLIGGSAVISETVEKELQNKRIKITRISGTNRADTSRLIAERYFPATSTAFVANGFSFADGLAAAPYAAKLNAPVLLVGNKAISSILINYVKTSAIKSITVVGGDGAVGPKVIQELRDAIQ